MKITTDNVKTIVSVLLPIVKTVKNRSDLWKNKSIPAIIISLVCVAAVLGTMIYFVATHYIGPLMIAIACCIPILSLGFSLQSKNVDNIVHEFDEYQDAMAEFVSILKSAFEMTDDDAVAAISTILVAKTNLTEDELKAMTYEDISKLPQFAKASKLVMALQSIQDALKKLQDEGTDVTEALESTNMIAENIDLSVLYDNPIVYQAVMGTSTQTAKDTATKTIQKVQEISDDDYSV